jgi:hypothetical protein
MVSSANAIPSVIPKDFVAARPPRIYDRTADRIDPGIDSIEAAEPRERGATPLVPPRLRSPLNFIDAKKNVYVEGERGIPAGSLELKPHGNLDRSMIERARA